MHGCTPLGTMGTPWYHEQMQGCREADLPSGHGHGPAGALGPAAAGCGRQSRPRTSRSASVADESPEWPDPQAPCAHLQSWQSTCIAAGSIRLQPWTKA